MQSRDWEAKKTMEFKGTLIVVKDCKKALKFYQDMFGFELIRDNDGNMELSENLYLQEEKYWERFTGKRVIPQSADMKDMAQILEQNGFTIMSSETNRISLNKGYTENGFGDKVYHIHLRYAGDNDLCL